MLIQHGQLDRDFALSLLSSDQTRFMKSRSAETHREKTYRVVNDRKTSPIAPGNHPGTRSPRAQFALEPQGLENPPASAS